MTIQAPLHLQRRGLRDDRHLIDPAMARRATDTFIHMNRMIEIGEVRQVVNAHPFQRLAVFETCAHRLEIWAVSPNLFVAIHADRGRRHAGGGRHFHRRVAVTAIDAVVADVMFVTELNRLLALDEGARIPSRAIDFVRHKQRGQQQKQRAVNRGPRQIVRAVTKNLWHRRRLRSLAKWTAALLAASERKSPPLLSLS